MKSKRADRIVLLVVLWVVALHLFVLAAHCVAQTVILHPQPVQSGWVYVPQPYPYTGQAWYPYTVVPTPTAPAPVVILRPDGSLGLGVHSNVWTVILGDDADD